MEFKDRISFIFAHLRIHVSQQFQSMSFHTWDLWTRRHLIGHRLIRLTSEKVSSSCWCPFSGSLSCSEFSVFPYKCQDGCSVSVKNAIGILLKIALKVYILLGGMDILALLILFHPQTQDIIPFICIFDFINVSIFSVCRYFKSLVKFIPWYFVLFDAVANWFSLSDGLSSVFRNAVDFCVLIW